MARVPVAQAAAGPHGAHASLPPTSRTTADCHAQGKHSLLYVYMLALTAPWCLMHYIVLANPSTFPEIKSIIGAIPDNHWLM